MLPSPTDGREGAALAIAGAISEHGAKNPAPAGRAGLEKVHAGLMACGASVNDDVPSVHPCRTPDGTRCRHPGRLALPVPASHPSLLAVLGSITSRRRRPRPRLPTHHRLCPAMTGQRLSRRRCPGMRLHLGLVRASFLKAAVERQRRGRPLPCGSSATPLKPNPSTRAPGPGLTTAAPQGTGTCSGLPVSTT